MSTADAPIRAGVRWLTTKRVTLGVAALLLAVFVFELIVLFAAGVTVWQYVFLATLEPTPGWVMAPFAHRTIAHLLSTLCVVVCYGALVEAWLSDSAVFAFYVAAGYVSTAGQLAAYLGGVSGLGTLGASGAALGLVALYVVCMTGRALWAPETVTTVDGVFTGLGLVIVAIVLANDLLPGIVLTTGTATFGHVGGIVAGVGYGLVVVRAQQRSTSPTMGRT